MPMNINVSRKRTRNKKPGKTSKSVKGKSGNKKKNHVNKKHKQSGLKKKYKQKRRTHNPQL